MLWRTDSLVIQAAITAWHEMNLLFLILDLSKKPALLRLCSTHDSPFFPMESSEKECTNRTQ